MGEDVYIVQPEKEDGMKEKVKTEEEAEVFFPPLTTDIDPRFTHTPTPHTHTHDPHNSHTFLFQCVQSQNSREERRPTS